MGMFEDTIINIKEAVGVIGKKTSKVVDASKLKLSAAEIESEIKKSFEKLGEIVYQNGVNDESKDSITTCITNIDKLYVKLDDIKSKIASAKNKKKCPNCDFENESEAVFCSKCGEKFLDDKSNENFENEKIEDIEVAEDSDL